MYKVGLGFSSDLEHSLSGKGYNTNISSPNRHQLHSGADIFLRNEEMRCYVYAPEISNEVLLSHIETKNCCIVPYKNRFRIYDYDSVEELADEILEVVNAYAGTEANLQKFRKEFTKSMNSNGCSGVFVYGKNIFFTYRGIEWWMDIDYSQAPNGIWCLNNLCPLGGHRDKLSHLNLNFKLGKWDVKYIVERILYYIDCYFFVFYKK